MKKQLRAGLLAAAIGAAAPTIHASGIPTVDVATGIILTDNAVQQAKEAADALDQARAGIEQAKRQYDEYASMVTGNSELADFLNNPALNKILPMAEWWAVYSDVENLPELRQRYGLQSDDPQVQKEFDKLLAATGALEENYNASTERVKNAEQLRAQLNVASTPQQKQDLQLRYQQEFLELQNQQMRMANMKALTDQEKDLENAKRSNAFNDYILGKTKTLPPHD